MNVDQLIQQLQALRQKDPAIGKLPVNVWDCLDPSDLGEATCVELTEVRDGESVLKIEQ